jgi:GGDEF domain-containing protein
MSNGSLLRADGVSRSRTWETLVSDVASRSGVGDGDFLFERLREEAARAARHRLPLALVVFNLDVPGASGPALDALTRAAVLLARSMVRHSDVVASLGYGHFGVVANATEDGAGTLADSVTRELQAFEFTCADSQLRIQVRYGLSCLRDGKTPRDLFDEARAALEIQSPAPEFQGQC